MPNPIFLALQLQNNIPTIWVAHTELTSIDTVIIELVPTGMHFKPGVYLGTVQEQDLVWHAFHHPNTN